MIDPLCTSDFHIMERMGQNQIRRVFRPFHQVAVPGAKSATSNCRLFGFGFKNGWASEILDLLHIHLHYLGLHITATIVMDATATVLYSYSARR